MKKKITNFLKEQGNNVIIGLFNGKLHQGCAKADPAPQKIATKSIRTTCFQCKYTRILISLRIKIISVNILGFYFNLYSILFVEM